MGGTQCVQWMYQSVNPPNASMSEDCLHLNIYTPRTPSAHASRSGNASSSDGNKLPIFFWVYGGGNTVGSTAFYGPVENLVTLLEGKAIVVAPNYRVGNFGFLALHELTEASPYRVSGNYGLLDLQMALQWVKTNAEGFGGDPNKVCCVRVRLSRARVCVCACWVVAVVVSSVSPHEWWPGRGGCE